LIAIALEIAGQAYGNHASGREVLNLDNYSAADIVIAGAIGVAGPGALGILQTALKAPGAIATLSRQLETAVSAARKAKLENRLAKYTSDLADSVGISAALQLIRPR